MNVLELPIWGPEDQTHPGRTAVRNADGSLTTWIPYWGGEIAGFENICFTAGGDIEIVFGLEAIGRQNGGRDSGFVGVWDKTLQQYFALIVTDSYIGVQGPDFWVSSKGETSTVARVRFEGVGSGKPETYTVWDGTSGRELATGQFSSRFAGAELCTTANVTSLTNDPGGIDVTFTHFAILVPPGTHHVTLR